MGVVNCCMFTERGKFAYIYEANWRISMEMQSDESNSSRIYLEKGSRMESVFDLDSDLQKKKQEETCVSKCNQTNNSYAQLIFRSSTIQPNYISCF